MKILSYLKQHRWLLLIVLLGSSLRLYRLDYFSLWMDEIYTMNVTNPALTFKEFHDVIVAQEGFPFFYFFLVKGFYAVLGYTSFAARLVSAVAGIASIISLYKLGKHLFSKEAGLCAALLLAINEYHIYYSQEARPYTLFFLFTIIGFYRLSLFIKAPSLKNGLWYGLATGLLLNTNFFGFVIVGSQALLLLAVLFFSKKEERLRTLWRSCLAGIIAIIMFLPNYEILVKLLKFKSHWVPRPNLETYGEIFKEMLGNSEVTMFIFGFILVFYAVSIFKRNEQWTTIEALKAQPHNYSFIILVVWMAVYFSYVYISSFGEASIALSRYLICVLPVCLLILGIGIAMIRNSIVKKVVLASIVFFVMANLVVAKSYYKVSLKSQFREISSFITGNNTNDTPVYTTHTYWFSYYLNNGQVKTKLSDRPLQDHVNLMVRDSAQRRSFWYADAHGSPYQLSPEGEQYLSEYFDLEENIEGYDAWARYYKLKTEGSAKIDLKKFGTLKETNGDAISARVEEYSFSNNILDTTGWAYFLGGEAIDTKIRIILVRDDENEVLSTIRIMRADVTSYFKSGYNIDNSGFNVHADLSKLEPGTYRLGIYMINNKLKKEGLIMTDKVVTKE